MRKPGPRNLITDVDGLLVGNAEDRNLKSGVTALLCEQPAIASVQVLGGAPGTRETDLLDPHNTVPAVNALVLSGGSAFGLDAASGVQSALREKGIGFEIGPHVIPIVPAAILFDLTAGGDKNWELHPPYRDLGYAAATNAAVDFEIGSFGAGTGAGSAEFKGGLGSASTVLDNGVTVGALVAANPIGSVNVAGGPHFWAAPFECGTEFGGLGFPSPIPDVAGDMVIDTNLSDSPLANSTIAVVATDAVLTKAEAKRLAVATHDGFARAIWPTHMPTDGDLVFAVATGKSGKRPGLATLSALCAVAAATMSRAIARGIYHAHAEPGDTKPTWQEKFGGG